MARKKYERQSTPCHAEPWQRRDTPDHQRPYGYKKAPEDKNHWIVDEPAAEVVRQIFRLSISGLGPTQIAKKLRSEGVMTPSEYFKV